MPFLVLTLLLIPIAEIIVFIEVGRLIGVWPTILGILLSAVLGAAVLRRQGLRTVHDAQAALKRDELPVRQLFDGFCLFLAGILLLVPGFLTDAIAILLLIGPVRGVMGRWLWDALRRHGAVTMTVHRRTAGRRGPDRQGPQVIDAEYHEVDEDEPAERREMPPPERSRWGDRRDR